ADSPEDPQLVGAMLVAVQDFIKDSFRGGSPVERMDYGESAIFIQRGGHLFLAVSVFGEPGDDFEEALREKLAEVEAAYAGVVEAWDGDKESFADVGSLLKPIWEPTSELTRDDVRLATTAREVLMVSESEFFQGFVRVKVAVVNNTSTV